MWKQLVLGTVLTVTLGTGLVQAQFPGMANPYRRNPFPQETYYEKMANQWVRLYLNRAPTPREMVLLTSQLRTGKTHEEVQANIISSDEYYRKSNQSFAIFLRNVFADVLGRLPTQAEVGMLIGHVSVKGRYRFALEFLAANRGLTRGAPVVTPVILLNYGFLPLLPY